ncbi:hypothetical protein RCL1_000922 [Eukaryota sp. TZLM3-RCL]
MLRQVFREVTTFSSPADVDNSPKTSDTDPSEWLCSPTRSEHSTDLSVPVSPPLKLDFTPRKTSLTNHSFEVLKQKFASGLPQREVPEYSLSIPDLPPVNPPSDLELTSETNTSVGFDKYLCDRSYETDYDSTPLRKAPLQQSPQLIPPLSLNKNINPEESKLDDEEIEKNESIKMTEHDDVSVQSSNQSNNSKLPDPYTIEDMIEQDSASDVDVIKTKSPELISENEYKNIQNETTNQSDSQSNLINKSINVDEELSKEVHFRVVDCDHTHDHSVTVTHDIDFGKVSLQSNSSKSIPLRNSSAVPVRILLRYNKNSSFSCKLPQSFIPPNSVQSLLIDFNPTASREYETFLEVFAESELILAVSLRGQGITSSPPPQSNLIDQSFLVEESRGPSLFSCPSRISLKGIPLSTITSPSLSENDSVHFEVPLVSLSTEPIVVSSKLFPIDSTGALITNTDDPRFGILTSLNNISATIPPKGKFNYIISVDATVEGPFNAVIVVKSHLLNNSEICFTEAVNITGTIMDTRVELSHASLEYGMIGLIHPEGEGKHSNQRVVEVKNKSMIRSTFLVKVLYSPAVEQSIMIESDSEDQNPIWSTPFLLKPLDSSSTFEPKEQYQITLDPGQKIKLAVLAVPICSSSSLFPSLRNQLSTHPLRVAATLSILSLVSMYHDDQQQAKCPFKIPTSSCVLSMRVSAPRIQVHRETKSRAQILIDRVMNYELQSNSDSPSVVLSSCKGSSVIHFRNGGPIADNLSFKYELSMTSSVQSIIFDGLNVVIEPASLLLEPTTTSACTISIALPVSSINDRDYPIIESLLSSKTPVELNLTLFVASHGIFLFSLPFSLSISLISPSLPLDLVCDKPVVSFGVCPLGRSSKSSLVLRNNALTPPMFAKISSQNFTSKCRISLSIPRVEAADSCFSLLINGKQLHEDTIEIGSQSLEIVVIFTPNQSMSYRSLLVITPENSNFSTNISVASEYRIPLLGSGGSCVLQIPSNLSSLVPPCSFSLRNSGTRTSALAVLCPLNLIKIIPDRVVIKPKQTIKFSISLANSDPFLIAGHSLINLVFASVDAHVLFSRKLAVSNSLPLITSSSALSPSENLIKSVGKEKSVELISLLNSLSFWSSSVFDEAAQSEMIVEQGNGSLASPEDRVYDYFYVLNDFRRSLAITTIEVTLPEMREKSLKFSRNILNVSENSEVLSNVHSGGISSVEQNFDRNIQNLDTIEKTREPKKVVKNLSQKFLDDLTLNSQENVKISDQNFVSNFQVLERSQDPVREQKALERSDSMSSIVSSSRLISVDPPSLLFSDKQSSHTLSLSNLSALPITISIIFPSFLHSDYSKSLSISGHQKSVISFILGKVTSSSCSDEILITAKVVSTGHVYELKVPIYVNISSQYFHSVSVNERQSIKKKSSESKNLGLKFDFFEQDDEKSEISSENIVKSKPIVLEEPETLHPKSLAPNQTINQSNQITTFVQKSSVAVETSHNDHLDLFSHVDLSPPPPHISPKPNQPILSEDDVIIYSPIKIYIKNDFITCAALALKIPPYATCPIKFSIKRQKGSSNKKEFIIDTRSGQLSTNNPVSVLSLATSWLFGPSRHHFDLFLDGSSSPIPLSFEVCLLDENSQTKLDLAGSRNGVHFREHLDFGRILIGSSCRQKIRICNGSNSDVTVYCPLIDKPFKIKHTVLLLKARSFVLIPVVFSPTNEGFHSLFLCVNSEKSESVYANITGFGAKHLELDWDDESLVLRNNSPNDVAFRVETPGIAPPSGVLKGNSEILLSVLSGDVCRVKITGKDDFGNVFKVEI